MPAVVTAYATARYATRLVLRGDLDTTAVPELTAQLEKALTGKDVREVVVDLAGVKILSAASANALAQARDYAVAHDIALALVGARGAPREVLTVRGVTCDVFTKTPHGLRSRR